MTSNEQNEGIGCGCLMIGVVISLMTGTWIPLIVLVVLSLLGAGFSTGIPGGTKKYSAENSLEIVEAVFAAAGYVEAGEGEIPPQSVQQARDYAARLSSGNAGAASEFMRVFMSGESEYQSKLSNVLGFIRRDSRMRYFLLNMISDIATADLNISQSELQRFVEVAGILGVGASEAQQILRSNGGSYGGSQQGAYQGREETDSEKAASGRLDLKRAYEILNVSSSDDDGSIKKAYRREANKHHPDKLRARGLPESMIKEETEKFELCNAAWEVIRQARGIR